MTAVHRTAELAAGTDAPVPLHPLRFLDEGDEVTVGRPDIDSYCVLPADGAALLQRLVDGDPPQAAAHWYEQTYGETVDMAEFLEALDELGFVADEPAVGTTTLRWQRLGRAVFSRPAWAGYATLVALTLVAVIRSPVLAPHYSQLFVSRYVTVIELTLFLGQIPFVLLHEAFHMLAGRRLGLPSRLSVGRRLYYIVFETSLDGLVAVPRRRRYLPILAGILCDVLVWCVLTLVAAVTGGTVAAVCLALAFTTLLRIVWQFYFYLRTDIYHLVGTVLGCVDLHRTAQRMLVNRARRAVGRADAFDESTFHPTDRRAARWYAWLIPLGYLFSAATLALAMIPTMFRFIGLVVDHLSGGGAELVDAVVFLALNLAQIVVLAAVVVRDRRRRRSGPQLAHVID